MRIPTSVILYKSKSISFRNVSMYVQGQEPKAGIREYFYYIDHQGMLFLDDARMKNFTSCFKEKKFLKFFFNQLRINNSNRYTEFPFLSPCGKEINYIRVDDCPFVFTNIIFKELDGKKLHHLTYNYADSFLSLKFEPEKIFMLPETGRLYHPAPQRAGSIGLIRSKLAIEISKNFLFKDGEHNPPTQFCYNSTLYNLDTSWYYNAVKNKFNLPINIE